MADRMRHIIFPLSYLSVSEEVVCCVNTWQQRICCGKSLASLSKILHQCCVPNNRLLSLRRDRSIFICMQIGDNLKPMIVARTCLENQNAPGRSPYTRKRMKNGRIEIFQKFAHPFTQTKGKYVTSPCQLVQTHTVLVNAFTLSGMVWVILHEVERKTFRKVYFHFLSSFFVKKTINQLHTRRNISYIDFENLLEPLFIVKVLR